jgi:heterodisulfide reductase subunit B
MDNEKKLKYGLFLGCVIPNRYPFIEASIRNVFDYLGAEIVELPGASCCPAPGVFRAFHIPSWLVIAARNVSIAEEQGVDIVTGCNGCFGTLRDAWIEMNHDPALKKEINSHLSKIGREFKGTSEPKHVVQALYLDMGIDYILDHIKYTFKDLKVAIHYGCHIGKPSDKRPWGNVSEDPRYLDEIIELTGAKSIDYKDKLLCCGAGGAVRSAIKEVSLDFTREKLTNIRDVGADVIVTACPFCHLQLDLGQLEVNGVFKNDIGEPFKIPVIYTTQLLGLAMGMDPNLLGLVKNHELTGVPPFISTEPFLNKVKEQLT